MHKLKFWFIAFSLCCFDTAVAGKPVWTFTPLTATQMSLAPSETAVVQYLVSFQSKQLSRLSIDSIPATTQVTTGEGVCGVIFEGKQGDSCTLVLEVHGNELTTPILGGPVACAVGSRLQCYRPATKDLLQITPESGPDFLVTPNSGPTSGGSGVTLTGTDFTSATQVTFGGVDATSVNVVDDTTITAVTPAHAEGAVDVIVTKSGGTSSANNSFTYVTTALGQPAFGGVIACLNQGLNNLIAATQDSGSSIVWGPDDSYTGATSDTDGRTNTTMIVADLKDYNDGHYAAKICDDYEIDSLGHTPCQPGNTCYNDWFLPAGDNTTPSGQLNCLYRNRDTIGNFDPNGLYWSSTEIGGSVAMTQFFADGNEYSVDKEGSYDVRCVRVFEP